METRTGTLESLAGFAGRHDELWLGGLTVVGLLVVGEIAVATRLVNPILLSAPSQIASAFGELWTTGELFRHARVSGLELLLGFGLAAAVGVPLGFAASLSRRLRWSLEPLLAALNAMPTVALIPLVIIWFGIGLWDKVAVVFLGAFLQIVLSTMMGVSLVNPSLLSVARSFAAHRRRVIFTVVLPSSFPFVLVGLRLGLGRALVGVVAAEFVASQAGIGFMVTRAGSYFQTAKVFAGILLISAMGIVGTWLIQRIERHVEAWRPPIAG
jgi:ABC-type nitrate/sulfonate/bicarbonate transport system permease component